MSQMKIEKAVNFVTAKLLAWVIFGLWLALKYGWLGAAWCARWLEESWRACRSQGQRSGTRQGTATERPEQSRDQARVGAEMNLVAMRGMVPPVQLTLGRLFLLAIDSVSAWFNSTLQGHKASAVAKHHTRDDNVGLGCCLQVSCDIDCSTCIGERFGTLAMHLATPRRPRL